ncbi:heat shock 70 kDa protein 12A-like isoform X3 [Mytilus californianus]|uniref:heat shock 70 kDa protein 12A-like isoform X3 n=1 Tax=Mytilus californianus TaxID=6549 RepID=UPI00224645AA|nr:heat shock 70 kDa protein 12A-like isoform X3 [Mytilus californianus]
MPIQIKYWGSDTPKKYSTSFQSASIKIIQNELLKIILGFYQEMSSLLVLLHVPVWLTIFQISTEVTLPFQCPHQSHKHMRSHWYCKNNLKHEYICLIDTERASSTELCVKTLDYAPPGQNYVWTGGFRNLDCKNHTFQPYALWQNESEKCLFEKSHCIDEGQTVFHSGTTETDSSCRCDHTRYYSFVSPTEHGEYCEPSKEDCSCYIKQCAYNEQLNSDYECINSLSEDYSSLTIDASINTTGVVVLSTFRENTRRNVKWSSFNVGVFIMIMIILFLIGGITFCWFLQKQTENYAELELPEPIVTVGPSRPIVKAGTATTEINESKPANNDQYIHTEISENSVSSTKRCFADIKVIGSLPVIFPASITYTLDIGHTVSIVYLIVSDLDTQIVLKRKNNVGEKFVVCCPVKTDTLEYVDGNFKKYFLTICSLKTNKPGIYFCDATNVVGTRTSKQQITVTYANEIMASLDIGSTTSNVAFICTEEYLHDERKIYTTRMHTGEKMIQPTCLLIKNANQKTLFGNDAKTEYEDCLTWDDSTNNSFFEGFRAKLCKQKDMLEKSRIEDVTGRIKMCTSEIFKHIIIHLKEMTIHEIKERHINVKEDSILWILTLPAEWYTREKDFFFTCCEKAGIQNSKLLMLCESKAAFIYCQSLEGKRNTPMLNCGMQHLIVDIGGGTSQLSVLQPVDANELKEQHPSAVLPCAGDTLDKDIMYFFGKIVGDRVVDDLKKKASCYNDIQKEFESAKMQHASNVPWARFSLPVDILNKLCVQLHNETFVEMLCKHPKVNMDIEHLTDEKKKETISLKGGKFFIGKDYLSELYQKVIDVISSEIINYLKRYSLTSITSIVLVGGLSNCRLVRQAIEKAFPKKKIFLADDSVFAVAKGAILFGCKPTIITTRITGYTYGRRIRPKFEQGVHNPKKKVKDDKGPDRCKDVFESFMSKNQIVPIGTTVKLVYFTVYPHKYVTIVLYMSEKDDPKYVDEEGCKKILEFNVKLSRPSKRRQYIDVECVFEYDKVTVKAVDKASGEIKSSYFQLY